MNKSISVSVIIPVYNAVEYLQKCLDSVINQTQNDIEIIIIDDGSTDGSSNICKSYADSDSRFVYRYKENEGLAAARQVGLDIAKGEYVGFVDSDDWIERNMFERMYGAAKENDADIVFCNCFIDDNEKNDIYLTPGVYNRERIEKEIIPRTLSGLSEKGTNSVIRWSNCLRIYKLSLIRDNNIAFGRRFRRSQDLQLTFETTLYAQKYVSLCDEYLYHNRSANNQNSLSRGYTKKYWSLIRPLIDKLNEDVDNYTNQDLHSQMALCAFFFAATGIGNECNAKKLSFLKKIKNLKEIVTDCFVIDNLKYIEYNKLHHYFKMIYDCLKSSNPYIAYFIYLKYQFKYNVYKPFARKIINGKITGIFFSKRKG